MQYLRRKLEDLLAAILDLFENEADYTITERDEEEELFTRVDASNNSYHAYIGPCW